MSELKTIGYDNTDDVQEDVVDLPTDDETRDDEDVDDGQDNFVDYHTSDEDEDADIGEDAEESDSEGAVQNSEKQSREENSAIRSARLRAERETEERVTSTLEREFVESGVINPLTNKPFKNLQELRAYSAVNRKQQLEARASREGRSVAELEEEALNREFITNMRRASEQNKQPTADFLKSDVVDFVSKHPEFNSAEKLAALENNKNFRDFCGSRFGREPLADLYDSYTSLVGHAGDVARAKSESRSARSTGSGNDGGEMLSPSEKRALDEWNKNFPEMKMTPKEFKARR